MKSIVENISTIIPEELLSLGHKGMVTLFWRYKKTFHNGKYLPQGSVGEVPVKISASIKKSEKAL